MSDEAKKSVISSLKELESMPTADTGEQQTARVAKGASRPNAPKTQALNLLSGILDETAAEAEAESQALELELKRKKEAAEAQARADKDRKERDLQERVLQEERRLREMEELRRKQEEVMRIEQLKAEGKWVEPEPEPPKPQIQSTRPVMTTQEVLAIQSKEKRGRMLVLAASIVLMLGIGGGTFWFISQQEFVDGASAHQKVAAEVVTMADAVADIAFNPIPERIVPEEVEQTGAATTRPRPRPRPGTSTTAEPQRPTIQLGGRIGGR